MKIETTPIRDVYVIMPTVNEDERGFLMETYRADKLASLGITHIFPQDIHSFSKKRNTVRGLHFQWQPPMAKIMRVTRGGAFLVTVDLRKNSPTLGRWFGVEASAENKIQLYSPGTFARGYQTLTDECEVQYKCSELYDPNTQASIRWDDPHIGITWPIEGIPTLSPGSQAAPGLAEWLQRPESDSLTY